MSDTKPVAPRPNRALGVDMSLVVLGDLQQLTLLLPTRDALALGSLLSRSSVVERDWTYTKGLRDGYFIRVLATPFNIRNLPQEIVEKIQVPPRKSRATATEKEPQCPA